MALSSRCCGASPLCVVLCSLILVLFSRPVHARPLRVLAIGYHVTTEPALSAKTRRWLAPDAALQRRLARAGITVEATIFTPGLTEAFLRRFDVVVLLGAPKSRLRGPVGVQARRQLSLLHRFVARGGGLLFLHAPAWSMGRQTEGINGWLRRYGGRVLREQVVERSPSGLHRDAVLRAPLGWTDNLRPHPVTRGVKGVFYPVARNAWNNFTQPVRVTRRWTVLLRGAATARSVRTRSAGDASSFVELKGTFSRAPPMLAVRRVGAGRLALWPTASTCLWQDGYHRRWGGGLIMEGGAGRMRGHGAALLQQLLRWLGKGSIKRPERPDGPSTNTSTNTNARTKAKGPVPLRWDSIRMRGKALPHHYVGLIGAQSNLSAGSASPEQMIRAAQDAGYKFLAFTEELSRMDAARMRRLIKVCRAACTDDFQAVPGFHYLDEAGNAHVVFGPRVRWPKRRWLSKRRPGRVTYNNVLFRGFDFSPLAVVRSSSNPKRPWLLGNFKGFAVYSYENGKLVDDSLAHYRALQAMGYNLFPMVLHLSRSPAAVKAARRATLMQTYVRWSRGRDPVSALTGAVGAVHRGKPLRYFPAFVSQGPIIEDFRTLNAGTADLAHPGRQRHRTRVAVSSDRGLERVELSLGPQRRYSFAARGKRFVTSVDGYHDRQRAPLLEVVDAAGRRAISWSRLTAVQEYAFLRSADNQNTFSNGKWFSGTQQPLRGIEDRVRHTTVGLLPGVVIDRPGRGQQELADTARPAVRQEALVAGRFGSVVEYSADGHYPPTTTGNWNLAVVEPWLPNRRLRFSVRVTRYRPRPDGAVVDLVETTVKALTDLTQGRRLGRGMTLARVAGRRGLQRLEVTGRHGGRGETTMAPGHKLGGPLPDGGYAVVSPAPGGSVAYVPLQSGLSFYSWRHGHGGGLWLLGGRPGQRLKSGQSLTFRFLSVNSGLGAAGRPGAGFVRDLVKKMGLTPGRRTAYAVKARRGKVLGRRFMLRLRAQRGAFSGTISRASLPLDLPVRLTGLNRRWDALLWYRGKGSFLVPRWKTDVRAHAAVRQRRTLRDELRRFPVTGGAGMVQIDTELGDRDVFLGHPVQASDRRLHILLADTRPGRERVWLHNSERAPITATVWRDPDFSLIPAFRKKVTVPAGGSVCVTPKKIKR